MIWIKKQTINPEVTDYYLETIANAYIYRGESIKYFYKWNEYKPAQSDITVVTRYKEVLMMLLKRRKYVYWVQGILPEENYAQKHSKLRRSIYELIERVMVHHTLKPGNYFLMVSNCMKHHFEKKYNVKIDNCYVMPCNNDSIHEESFDYPLKYDEQIFCYAGGLSVWQCIDETLDLYKRIEECKNNTKLILLVPDKEAARKKIIERNIKNYEIDFVPIEKLPEVLRRVKYGFIIRKDIELNRVATPTKLMTYIGNGVIPIISDCLKGLSENLNESEYTIKLSSVENITPILEFMDKQLNSNSVKSDYKNLYSLHYDVNRHIQNMATLLP